MYSPHNLILPVATQSTHPIYTLFRGHEGGMVVMGYQDETVEMESQEAKEKRETLVYRDHLAFKVCYTLFSLYTSTCLLSSDCWSARYVL